ncbi:xanthine dehydrogenase family protein molybdopterin-binding subunit [Parasulfitobacter algicola]|uniref:Xanthine dehydrogenase family protein molybdopterin-binding subunit n=1 Tax=Parasulfitobacter algicola TaxID=2614809 RepID=A0ABX2IUB6_9RHOB|nr:molybdopterin cofactor-binding domain-containing protein [Sulfitobacter algicola]NSX56479.1 xanthine dehydrogenase family protein molybdopterin-binding subunit [Sulfitobacter algicola]
MSRLGKIARRTFLIGSAAVVGGVAFGVWQARRELENPLRPEGDAVTLNPYIIIDQSGTTIIAPRAEMGQGIMTTLAALAAEELDVDFASINVIHGPAAQAYYNGVMMGLSLPFKDYAVTDFQDTVKETVGVVGKIMGLQVTGGSTSTVDAFEKMRMAGATARETLKTAAANQWGVQDFEVATENGQVIGPNGQTLSYADLAQAAAAIEPPAEITLRPASEWKLLGTSLPRVDMVGKATGTAEFGADVRLPGMKFATVRMNPKRAGMIRFDASAAETMPGVEKIVDLGDGIAVIANNTWLAMKAAEAVEIEWEAASYPATTAALRAEIVKAFDTSANSTMRGDGDVDTAIEGATEITAEYHVPWLAHSTMEPMNSVALYTDSSLEIWSGTQAPTIVRDKCAAAVDLKKDAVTVHTTYLGGGFGRRGEFDFAVLAARVAQAMPGTPVKTTWSREEDMRHDFYRPAASARFRGLIQNGKAVLLDGKIAAPSVTRAATMRLAGFAAPGPDKGHVEGAFDQPYGIPNYRITGHLADVSVPIGFWRSVGNSFNGFFFDSFIDEMAHAANRDPLEFRHELIAREHAPSAALLDEVAEMSGWTGSTIDGVGRGVAFTYSFGTPVAQVVEVVQEDGLIRIQKAWIACDVGLALDKSIIEAQMISGLIYGLSAAVQGDITFADGEAQQYNFPDYDALRMHNAPQVDVRILENNAHMGGVGEPATPPSMPALANALFDLSGTRVRDLPLNKEFDFLL